MQREAGASPWVRLCLAQGIAGPVLYAAAAIVGGMAHPGYSHISNAVSELTAAGAPNQGPLLAAFAMTELQKIMFGAGIFVAVRGFGIILKASAAIMVLIGFFGIGFARFPMGQIGAPQSFEGQMHIAIVSVSAVLAIASISLAGLGWRSVHNSEYLSQWSFAMLAVMLVSGMVSAMVAANGWSGLGAWQRVNIGAFGAWQIATSVHLLRRLGTRSL